MKCDNRVKAVIFDMDGVLVNSMEAHATAWQRTFQELGISIQPQDIYLIEGSNHRGVVKTILARHQREYSDELASMLSRRKIQHFNSLYTPGVYHGVDSILRLLRQHGFRLAVASGSNKSTVHSILSTCFTPDTFDVVITGDEVASGKPSPETYLAAISKLRLAPRECIVVENAPRGIAAARAAGCFCIAITTTLSREYLRDADVVVENHRELCEFLRHRLCLA